MSQDTDEEIKFFKDYVGYGDETDEEIRSIVKEKPQITTGHMPVKPLFLPDFPFSRDTQFMDLSSIMLQDYLIKKCKNNNGPTGSSQN